MLLLILLMPSTDRRFLCKTTSLFLLMVMVFPLSCYMLVLLIDPHKQLLFAPGKIPLGPLGQLIHDSTFKVQGWFQISGALIIHDKVSLV